MSEQKQIEQVIVKEKSEIAALLTHAPLTTGNESKKAKRVNKEQQRHQHVVGQLEQNIDKVLKILNKTQYVENVQIRELIEGNPTRVLRILHHLLFKVSKKFTVDFLKEQCKVDMEIQYLPDGKFYRNLCLLLTDVFGYKPAIAQDQFFQEGYSERKLILVLDVYDFLKEVKHSQKVQTTLAAHDSGPYPSDIPTRTYEVINHRTNEATKFHFKMNATLQKSSTVVLQKTEIPPVGKLIQQDRFNEAHYEKVMKGAQDDESSMYSLSRHHHNSKRKHRKGKGSRTRKQVIEPIKEETVESVAALKDSIQAVQRDEEQEKENVQTQQLAALLNDYIAQVSTKMDKFESEIDTKLSQIKTHYSTIDQKLLQSTEGTAAALYKQ